ncbi:MAG: hypothetical protein OSB82_08065 [Alphaproteobacteria bacterium]|nr:hypothetical protein [Alphaproteobacteria bacterium]
MQQGQQPGSGGKTPPRRQKKRDKGRAEPIVAHNSKIKLGVLAAPCVVVAISSLSAAIMGIDMLGGGTMLHLAGAGIGGLTAFTLLQMAFDQKPVLIIDDEGIRCRRPDVGLIPWHAVVGLGTSKATLLRRVLMVAVDDDELEEQAARHMRRRVGMFAAFSPQAAKFEGQMKGWPSIHVPISYFDISVKQLELQLAEKVRFHGKKD